MKTPLLPLLILLITLPISCSGNNGAHTDTLQLDTVAPDTVYVSEEPAAPADTVLTDDISTAEEAIAYMDSSQYAEAYRAGILHTMANDNPDYCIRLLKSRYPYFIVVDKPSMFVVLFDRFGRELRAYKMACSRHYGTKHKRRDNRTPEGFFSAEGVYNSTEWLYTDDDGYTSPTRGVYGPRFIRLKTNVTSQVGIHGTGSPGSLGRRVSHGCIRLHNNNIVELVKFVTAGTPIIVNPSERDQQVNRKEGYKVPSINIGKPTETVSTPVSDAAIERMIDNNEAETARADSMSIPVDTIIEIPSSTPQQPQPDSLAAVKPDTVAAPM